MHEFRVVVASATWLVLYAIRPEEIVILDIFKKKIQKTPANLEMEYSPRNRKTRLDSPGKADYRAPGDCG